LGDREATAISVPWFQVIDRGNAAGRSAIRAFDASCNASPSGCRRCSKRTIRVRRSTSVPIAESLMP
jgi:hypothetical protein